MDHKGSVAGQQTAQAEIGDVCRQRKGMGKESRIFSVLGRARQGVRWMMSLHGMQLKADDQHALTAKGLWEGGEAGIGRCLA